MFPNDANIVVLREVIRLSEKYLDAQLTIMGALAQRAGALAGVLGAGATAMLGAELLVLNALNVKLNLAAYGAALVSPMVMFAGCAYCGRAAGTSTFQTSGNFPSAWSGNVSEADLNEAFVGELENYEKYIKDNHQIIADHARYLKLGLILGFASPIVLALIGAAFFYCHHK